MSENKVDRRKLITGAAATSGALLAASRLARADDVPPSTGIPQSGDTAGADKAPELPKPNKRFGDHLIPPSAEGGREKHVPVITAPAKVKKGEPFEVTITIGTAVEHPNTVEHHIVWMQLYAKEEGGRPMVQIAEYTMGPTLAGYKVTFPVMLSETSELYALSYCNIHGVWDYGAKVIVE